MCTKKLQAVFLISLSVLTGWAWAGQQSGARCVGVVVDAANRPVSDARVTLYGIRYAPSIRDCRLQRIAFSVTDANGVFTFSDQTGAGECSPHTTMLVQQPPFAVGWGNWNINETITPRIVLAEPAAIRGTIVDRDKASVPDTQVSISTLFTEIGPARTFFSGLQYDGVFTIRTDGRGRFEFANLPPNARMEFTVNKAGYAAVDTLNLLPAEGYVGQFRPGLDVTITLPQASAVRGSVLDESGNPLGGVPLVIMAGYGGRIPPGYEPVISAADGSFVIGGIEPGLYFIDAMPSRVETAAWVVEPTEVRVVRGKDVTGLVVRAKEGVVAEFLITVEGTGEPVEGARVQLKQVGGKKWFYGLSDESGRAAIRVIPGEYLLHGVYSDKYTSDLAQRDISLRPGGTLRYQLQLSPLPHIAGLVADERGTPVEGAIVSISALRGRQTVTDPEGGFHIAWRPGRLWPTGAKSQPGHIFVRDTQRNLAASFALDEGTDFVNVRLTAGVTVSGLVMDEQGRGIANAIATPHLRLAASSWPIDTATVRTASDGRFQISALPRANDYTMWVEANQYATRRVNFDTKSPLMQIDLGKIELSPGSLQIAGIVVDAGDRPVPGARLTAIGRSEAVLHTVTDARGRFLFDNVSESEVVISAAVQGLMNLSGAVQTKSPAQDVKIVVRDAASAVTPAALIPTGPLSLANNDLPDLKELAVDMPDDEMKGRMLLVAFWDMNQRPSRHCITQLSERADQLKQMGVTVIAVQAVEADENTVSEWLNENNIALHTGIIKTDYEKTTSKWGVASLPWLILTDTKHKVRAEGFGLDDVNEKIKEITGA